MATPTPHCQTVASIERPSTRAPPERVTTATGGQLLLEGQPRRLRHESCRSRTRGAPERMPNTRRNMEIGHALAQASTTPASRANDVSW